MELVGSALLVAVVLGLWIAAALSLFRRDTRDGSDWLSRSVPSERPRRIGD